MGTATRAVSRYSDWFVAAKSDAETTSDSDRIERLPLHVQKQSKYEQAKQNQMGQAIWLAGARLTSFSARHWSADP